MDMSVAFVANLQASKRVKPGNRALDLPTRFAQSAAIGRANFCEQGRDATFAQALPMWLGAVAPVALNDLRLVQGMPPFAPDVWNDLDQCVEMRNVVTVAPLRMTASGMPCASTMRWCLLPSLRRSVGFGPVFFPPAWRELTSCRRWHALNLFRPGGAVRPAPFRGYVAIHRPSAMRRAVPSRPCLSRSPFLAAAGSTQCPSAARTRCQSARLGLVSVCGPHTGNCAVLAREEAVR